MRLSRIAELLCILPFTLAQLPCSESEALPWGDDACATYCEGQTDESVSDCLTKCYAEASQGQCDSVGCPGDEEEPPLIRKLKARQSFTCTGNQACFKYKDGQLLCIDTSNGASRENLQNNSIFLFCSIEKRNSSLTCFSLGDFSDADGGTGNIETGEYTYPDGSMTTVTGTPGATGIASASDSAEGTGGFAAQTSSAEEFDSSTPISTHSSTAPRSSSTPVAATTSTSAPITAGAGNSATTTSVTVATTTSKAGAETGSRGRAAGAVGALGLVVGFIL
jgi:hypothetical protein